MVRGDISISGWLSSFFSGASSLICGVVTVGAAAAAAVADMSKLADHTVALFPALVLRAAAALTTLSTLYCVETKRITHF